MEADWSGVKAMSLPAVETPEFDAGDGDGDDRDRIRCPWCGGEHWVCTVEPRFFWFECKGCGCMWSRDAEWCKERVIC